MYFCCVLHGSSGTFLAQGAQSVVEALWNSDRYDLHRNTAYYRLGQSCRRIPAGMNIELDPTAMTPITNNMKPRLQNKLAE